MMVPCTPCPVSYCFVFAVLAAEALGRRPMCIHRRDQEAEGSRQVVAAKEGKVETADLGLKGRKRVQLPITQQGRWESYWLEAWPPSTSSLGTYLLPKSCCICSLVFSASPGSPHQMRVTVWTGLLPFRAHPGSLHRSLCTLAASTILAVASARILAALNSLREFSRSLSPSASALMALTRSEVAWARMRACRTISPEGTGHNQVRTRHTEGDRGAGQWCRQRRDEAFCDHRDWGEILE